MLDSVHSTTYPIPDNIGQIIDNEQSQEVQSNTDDDDNIETSMNRNNDFLVPTCQ